MEKIAKRNRGTEPHVEDIADFPQATNFDFDSDRVMAFGDSRVLFLYNKERICFQGRLQMRVLHGQVTVLGYIAQPSSHYIDLYAPYTHQAVVIDTLDPLHSELAYIKRLVPAGDSKRDELAELALAHVTKKHAAVIVLRAMENDGAAYHSAPLFGHLFEYPARRLGNADEGENGAEYEVDAAYDPLELGDMHVVTHDNGAQQVLALPHEWLTLRKQLLTANTPPVLFICGRKGSGKSTLARWLANSLLYKYPRVLYMDLDPGQTEFTPPGLISLNEITAPIVGPPSTHMRDPIATHFIGDITPQNNVDQFEQSAIALFTAYNELNREEYPMIINSHGWMQNLGYTSQIRLINHFRPQRIVQLAEEQSKAPIRIADLKTSQHGTDWVPLVHTLPIAESAAPRVKHSATDYRSHAYRCYFEDARCRTLRVSWRHLTIAFTDELPPSQALYALNGTVVALAVDTRPRRLLNKGLDTNAEQLPKFLRHQALGVISCAGLGIIKAIDVKQKCYLISTPLALSQLAPVNTIVRGRLHLPNELLLESPSINSPYITTDSISGVGTGATELKSRALLRHRFDKQ